MRQERDRVAEQLYRHIHPARTEAWADVGADCRAFYRRLADWHLRELAAALQPTIPFDSVSSVAGATSGHAGGRGDGTG